VPCFRGLLKEIKDQQIKDQRKQRHHPEATSTGGTLTVNAVPGAARAVGVITGLRGNLPHGEPPLLRAIEIRKGHVRQGGSPRRPGEDGKRGNKCPLRRS
jgi:hypothetical protein